MAQDSIWWPLGEVKQIELQNIERARQMKNKGVKVWGNLQDRSNHNWWDEEKLQKAYNQDKEDTQLIKGRIALVEPHDCWNASIKDKLSPKGVG